MAQCTATTQAGVPCQRVAKQGSLYCGQHVQCISHHAGTSVDIPLSVRLALPSAPDELLRSTIKPYGAPGVIYVAQAKSGGTGSAC